MIELKNINKYYITGDEKLHALKDINLKVEDGDFLAIMGPSGSGKSTLIKILGLIDKKYTGVYEFNGQDINTLKDNVLSKFRNKEIGFVFQNFNLIKRLTVRENVELPMLYAGKNIKDTKEIVTELLKKVGIENKDKQLPSNLSGGQQQRVSIARSLVNNPSLIIADEPTGALDSKTSKEIMDIFNELNKEGITIIVITHDINVANRAKKVMHIFDGELREGDFK